MTRTETWPRWLAVAAILVLAFVTRGYFVDDAFIGFRCVDNALHGQGLVFNPPDRIETMTNIGWLLVLLPFASIVPVTAAAKVLSILFVLALLLVLSRFAAPALAAREERIILILLPLMIAASRDFTYFSLTGMETPLAAFSLVLMLVLTGRRRPMLAWAVGGALMFLVRPECILLFPLAAAWHCGRNAALWKKAVPSIAVFLILVAVLTLARTAYYGHVLPITFLAKSTAWDVVAANALDFLKGTNSNFPAPFYGWLALPVWVNGIRLWRHKSRPAGAFLAAALSTGIVFCLYAKPDWTGMGRYFAPYVPIALLIFLTGLADIVRWLSVVLTKSRRIVPLVVGLTGFSFIVAGGAGSVLFLRPSQIQDYPGYVLTSASLIEPSEWMRSHLPGRAVIAAGRIGAVGYYSMRHIFDYKFGLTDPAVARLRRGGKEPFEDPRDPALAGAWIKADPGYYLEDLRRIRLVFGAGHGKTAVLAIHGGEFRPLKSFPIGLGAEWMLYERIGASTEKSPLRTGFDFPRAAIISN